MVSGKEFRKTLHKPLPGAPKQQTCRIVPAFTIQAMQKGTCVLPPPKCNPFAEVQPKPSNFRMNYMRGDFPISFEANGTRVSWKVGLSFVELITFKIFQILNIFDSFAKFTNSRSISTSQTTTTTYPCSLRDSPKPKTLTNSLHSKAYTICWRTVAQKFSHAYPN